MAGQLDGNGHCPPHHQRYRSPPLAHHCFPPFQSPPKLLAHLREFLANPPPPSVPTARPDLLHLASLAPHSTPPLADCSQHGHPRTCTTLSSEYFTRWHAGAEPTLLYLKDWHLPRLLSDAAPFYSIPPHFADDWLNEFATSHTPPLEDYRFVYASPRGCFTALHSDVLRSYSWSANVVGRKLWLMMPPEVGRALLQEDDEGYAVDLLDEEVWGRAAQVDVGEVRVGVQEEGEVVFVPSGWVHEVWQVDNCVSINHNFINGWSLPGTWAFLKDEEAAARRTLAEFECARSDATSGRTVAPGGVDEEGVQLMMRANAGMNRADLDALLTWAIAHEQRQLDTTAAATHSTSADDRAWRREYLEMSLHRARAVLSEVRGEADACHT